MGAEKGQKPACPVGLIAAHPPAAVNEDDHGKLGRLGLVGPIQVQHLVGREVYVRRSQLPPPADDEYYWHDLLGLQVVTDAGRRLGELSSIIETGSNDVYVVTDGER